MTVKEKALVVVVEAGQIREIKNLTISGDQLSKYILHNISCHSSYQNVPEISLLNAPIAKSIL